MTLVGGTARVVQQYNIRFNVEALNCKSLTIGRPLERHGILGREICEPVHGRTIEWLYPDIIRPTFRHGVREGEIAFMQKPITTEVLTKRVRALLDEPAAPARRHQ